MVITLMISSSLLGQENDRLRDYILDTQSIISNQSNVIGNLKTELYISDLYVSNLQCQLDIELEKSDIVDKKHRLELLSARLKSSIIGGVVVTVALTAIKIFLSQ